MDKIAVSHQNLKEFLETPFGQNMKEKNLKYEDRYQAFKKNNRITVVATLKYMDRFFIHVKVPSESQKADFSYDVVVEFDPPGEKENHDLGLDKYYVQFFSNSPGFVYRYATLYKMQGYLIESLYEKFPAGALDTLPDKANKDYELYFDSSIYYACRFILDNRVFLLGKITATYYKRAMNPQAFFSKIMDTEEINISRDVSKLSKELKGETLSRETVKKLSKNEVIKDELEGNHYVPKKSGTQSTVKGSGGQGVKKISAKSSTSKASSSVVRTPKVQKRHATRQTGKKST